MKTIMDKRLGKKKLATAKNLIEVCLANELTPVWVQQELRSLQQLLESVATPRNKTAAHGQGLAVRRSDPPWRPMDCT